MKKLGLLIIGLAVGNVVLAQDLKEEYAQWKQQRMNEYKEYSEKTKREYAEFRKRANAEYAEFMKGAWRKIKGENPIPIPQQPKPPEPVVAPNAPIIPERKPIPIPHEEVEPIVIPTPIEIVPEPIVKVPTSTKKEILYYETKCTVYWSKEMMYKLEDLNERTLSKMWEQLSTEMYDPLLKDCLQMKREMNLCDWAYIEFVRSVSKGLFGSENNEAIFLEQYLLVQSGMRVRMAKTENGKLMLLVPFEDEIYNYMYVNIEGVNYYALTKGDNGMFRVFDQEFPQEQMPSIAMMTQPRLDINYTAERVLKSKRYSSIQTRVRCNQNLIDFYDDYPISSRWDLYSKTSISEDVKAQIYPKLKQVLMGESEKVQVDMLLNFVQTSFEYKTDPEQFGEERPLFADESFYYPYNDCEDRSIVFSILVRDLIGLDVVLLHYPGHLATAVKFNSMVYGDYLEIDGENYIVCDPTYIGAYVGMSMPQYQDTPAKVVKLK